MEENEFLDILIDTIQNGRRHKYYDHVVEMAKVYNQIVTGKVQELIIKFDPREDEEAGKFRTCIHNSITPHMVNQLKNEFRKVDRTTPKVDRLVFDNANEDDKDKFRGKLENFKGKRSFRDYIKNRTLFGYFSDPNGFIIFEREDESIGGVEHTGFYPFEVSSKEAINYEEDNGNLQWLIVRVEEEVEHEPILSANSGTMGETRTFEYLTAATKNEAGEMVHIRETFYIYYAGGVIVARQKIDKNEELEDDETERELDTPQDKKTYLFSFIDNGSTEIPAIKVGAEDDPCSDLKMKISPLFYAEGPFKDVINDKSRLEITKMFHTFLKQYVYVEKCDGEAEDGASCKHGCYGGDKDRPCQTCGGDGKMYHTTDTDRVEIYFPEDEKTPVPLSTFQHYVQMPLDTPKFQAEELEKAIARVEIAIFGSRISQSGQVGKTVSEVDDDIDRRYNILFPYANKIAEICCLGIRILSQYTGIKVKPYIEYDHDFKLRTLKSLIEDYECAKRAGLGSDVLKALEEKVIDKLYSSDQSAVKDILAFNKYRPFNSLTDQQIASTLTQRAITDRDRLLFENFDRIQCEITVELADKGDNFYILPTEMQDRLIKEKLDEISASLSQQNLGEVTNIGGLLPRAE